MDHTQYEPSERTRRRRPAFRAVVIIGVTGLLVLVGAAPAAHGDDTSSGSDSSSGTATTGAPASPKTRVALRAAAMSWAKAFLTGTGDDMRNLQGPECTSTPHSALPKSAAASYLRGLRALMRDQLGEPLDQVRLRAVALRNVTARRGEAQVLYDLPISKVGNDNWVEFTLHDGHWRVSNCKAPILGHSTRSAASNVAPAAGSPSTASSGP